LAGLIYLYGSGAGPYPYAETARHPASATVDYKSTIAALSDQRKNEGQEAEQERGGGSREGGQETKPKGGDQAWGQRARYCFSEAWISFFTTPFSCARALCGSTH
jgi:hypothetical protein